MLYFGIIILLILTIFLFTRLFSLKKEIKHLSKQLKLYNSRKTGKKIDMSLFDQDIENLGQEINRLIDLHVKENREKIRFENEQKQAIANISHDLRTPLTSIMGYIQMAESDEATDEEKTEYLLIAKKRAKRLETLLHEFFELSVIESSDYDLKTERINLRNLTIDVLMSFYDRFNQNNIEPTFDIPENDMFILSDRSAVTRVIENLISNAITHSDGNLLIRLEEKDSLARLTVKNDAHSLTQQEVDRIFDRFYMADQSRSGKSTGLGLSIVKSLMDKMNGRIIVNFEEGQLSIACEWEVIKG